jgi:Zn-dependent peptidase ImmA (M78 family)
MAVRRKRIRQIVEELLEENEVKGPPVDVKQIAEARGLSVISRKVENISGFIIRKDGTAVIGVNSSNAPVRQRFTIAHELGHYLMHSQNIDDIHVDNGFDIRFRDDLSSQGTDSGEREANYFAAELLMPLKFLESDLENKEVIELHDDKFLDELAKNYNVSKIALHHRLNNLGLLNFNF